ncbi:MAG: BamA/TamA family outer membrane protein [bacterium]
MKHLIDPSRTSSRGSRIITFLVFAVLVFLKTGFSNFIHRCHAEGSFFIESSSENDEVVLGPDSEELKSNNEGDDQETVYLDSYKLIPKKTFNHLEFGRLSVFSLPSHVSRAAIERTVENLLKTGKVKQVDWRVEDTTTGACLIIEMERGLYVKHLRFYGNKQIGDASLRYATDLRKFGPFSDETLTKSLTQIEDYYISNGFPAPGLSSRVSEPDRDGAVAVKIDIDERRLPKPDSIKFIITGNPGMAWDIRLKTIFGFLKRKTDRNGLNLVKLKNRLKDEQRLLRENGYQNAEITVEILEKEENTLGSVLVTADIGNPVRIKFENVGFLTRRDILVVWKKRHAALTLMELDRLAQTTRDRLRNDGWLEAEVETHIEEQGTVTKAFIRADPGRRHHVKHLDLTSESPIASNKLAQITGLYPPRLWGLWKTRPGPDAVNRAEKALQTYLETQGYQRSRSRITLSDLDRRGITAEVETFPGQRQLIGSIAIEGAEGIDREKLLKIAGDYLVSSGKPLVNRRIRDVMTAITRLYWTHGYSDMSIQAHAKRRETATDIVFDIHEGPAYLQGSIIIAGNVKTRSSLIYRLEKLAKGKPFRLEKIGALQEAMYQTGVFDSVSIHTTKYPDESPPNQTVMVEVSERSTGEFETGVDFNTDRGLEGIVEIGERNLFGRALYGKVGGLLGEKRRGASLMLQRPLFWGHRLENRFRVNWTDDRTNIGYDLQKLRLELGAVHRWRDDMSLNVTYAFEREWVRDIHPDIAETIELKDTRYGSLTPVLTIDKRDDPFRSTRGWMFQVRLKSSLDTFGTESEFFRWDQDIRWFVPIDNERIIIGMAARTGKAWVIGNSILPTSERFYLGGAMTNRGFDHQMCGPLTDEGRPLGGISFLLTNLEARFHLAGNWKGAVFVDAGNVFSESMESPYLRPSAGFGLRYETPIGPIRGDIGWNLDRKPGEATYAIQFALGHAF